MNATSRTLIFAAVACVSAIAAVSAWFASRPAAIEGYADVGQEFFPDFKDPLKATSLSVTEYNEKAREPREFSVRQDDAGQWVIPSHHNYPAEAQERLARTAASLIGVSKTAVQSRSKEDWKLYAVVDPAAEGAATTEERGTRVSLKDASGNPLVDLIVGRQVEGRENHYYVREPEKNTTYIAQMKPDLSASFSDWIEPDLLKVNQADIVSIKVDNYSIDEEQGAILEGEKLDFAKENLQTTGKWILQGLDEATEKLDEAPVRAIATNLDTLKIVGVRPKPEGLNPDLTVTPEVAQNPLLRQVLQADMQRQGFYVANSKEGGVRLVSNEGELLAGTANGVQYTLYFGEIARGTDKDIEIGFAAPQADDAAAADDAAKPADAADPSKPADADKPADEASGGPRRYLLVKVNFDESLLGAPPAAPVPPVKPEILNDTPAQPTPAADKPAAEPGASEQPAPAEPKADPAKPAEAAPGDAKPAEPRPADPSPAAPGSEAPKPAEPPAAEPAPADPQPADDGSCGPADEPAAPADPAPATDAAQAAPAEPAAEPPAAQPAADQPAADKPAADKPAADKPADAPPAAQPADAPAAQTPPADAAAPAAPAADPRQEAQAAYDKAMGEYEAQKAAYERDMKARDEKIKQGQKTAEELSARFSSWYYVISADSFDKFRMQRKDVVGPKTADDAQPGTSAAPGGSPVPGLPSFNLPGVPN